MIQSPHISIVTGAGSGIGRALVTRLNQVGAQVLALDIDEAALETLRVAHPAISIEVCDVTNGTVFADTIGRFAGRYGHLDQLFNCAGTGVRGDAREIPPQVWREAFEINYFSVMHGSLAAYRLMAEQGFGHIVNVASLAGVISAPTVIPYAAAKHAVVGFSTSLRAEAESLGVKVTCVCPGPIATGFYRRLVTPGAQASRPQPPAVSLSAEQAADQILKSVKKNKALTIFPRQARWIARFYRWCPPLFAPTNASTMRNFRRVQANNKSESD